MLQRKQGKVGQGLGKTTGWIHRAILKRKNVVMLNKVEYQQVSDEGLHILQDGEASGLDAGRAIDQGSRLAAVI